VLGFTLADRIGVPKAEDRRFDPPLAITSDQYKLALAVTADARILTGCACLPKAALITARPHLQSVPGSLSTESADAGERTESGQ
jgi:hypothetical protein